MKALPFLLLVALSSGGGCPPPPTPTNPPDMGFVSGDMSPPSNGYGIPTCPTAIAPTISDVCDGMFVKEGSPGTGLSCVHCAGAGACYDSVDAMYCAKGKPGCLDDDACVQVNDGSDGSPGVSKKKAKKPFKKVPSHMRKT